MQRWIALLAALYSVASHADTIVTTTTTTVVTTDPVAEVSPLIIEPPPQVGGTFAIGVMSRGVPRSVRSGSTSVIPTEYTVDAASAKSLWISLGVEKEGFVFLTDVTFGGAPVSGMTRALADPPFQSMDGAPFAYTGTLLESSLVLRLGARVSHGNLAFSAGAGLGGTLWIIAGSDVERGSASVFDAPMGPSGPTPAWFVPVWAEATYKASESWGIRLLGSSDRASGNGPGTTTLGLAAVFQPTSPMR